MPSLQHVWFSVVRVFPLGLSTRYDDLSALALGSGRVPGQVWGERRTPGCHGLGSVTSEPSGLTMPCLSTYPASSPQTAPWAQWGRRRSPGAVCPPSRS